MIKIENEYGNLTTTVNTQRELDRHLENGWHIVEAPKVETPAEEPKTETAPAAKKTTKKAAKRK